MRESSTVALWARDTLCSGIWPARRGRPSSADEGREWLEERLRAAMQALATAESAGDPTRIACERTGVFLVAAALATYGDLDRAELALEHVPDRGRVRPLAGLLRALLSIPASLDPASDPSTALAWLRGHRDRLRWVPDSHFELRPSPTSA